MPNYYAHIRFCLEVRKRLSPRLRAILTAERDAYLCGGFGPDPLYFHAVRKRAGNVRQAAIDIHHHSGAAAMEPFRRPVAEGWPYSLSFAAGYLMHYLLDAHCHPYVLAVAAEGKFSHFALEGEYDRYLMVRDGLSLRQALPKRPLPWELCRLAAEMAPEVTPEIYRQALAEFRWTSLRLGGWAGTPLRGAVNAVSHVPPARGLRGMILGKQPQPGLEKHIEALEQRFMEAVELAEVELGRFLGAVESGLPFSEALGRDFSGNKEKQYGDD